jgi:hypothetical protein
VDEVREILRYFPGMDNRRLLPLVLLALSIGAGSCSEESPGPTGRLSLVYADLLKYRSAHASADSATFAGGVDSVLTSHGYDRQRFEHEFLAVGSGDIAPFFDDVARRLNTRPDSSGYPE